MCKLKRWASYNISLISIYIRVGAASELGALGNYLDGSAPSCPSELKSPVLQEMLGISKFEKPR